MPSRHKSLLCLMLCCAAISLRAQTPAQEVNGARKLYYTPVDAGLKSFHCDVNFDWKGFIQKASNQAVPDADPRLHYLQTIQLSVDDDLRGSGELHWNAPSPPPDNTEDSVSKIRDGMQQMWSGFFQSWNGFITGDLVTLDAKATAEHTPAGYHVAVRTGPGLAEETFDNTLLLKSVHVTTPTLESTVTPTFTPGPQGLLVTGIASSYKQPPSAPPTEVRMDVQYGPVGTFQLPSALRVNVGPASFEYKLANCTVATQLTSK